MCGFTNHNNFILQKKLTNKYEFSTRVGTIIVHYSSLFQYFYQCAMVPTLVENFKLYSINSVTIACLKYVWTENLDHHIK